MYFYRFAVNKVAHFSVSEPSRSFIVYFGGAVNYIEFCLSFQSSF